MSGGGSIDFGWCFYQPRRPPLNCRWCNERMALIRPNRMAAYICPNCDQAGKKSRGVPNTRK